MANDDHTPAAIYWTRRKNRISRMVPRARYWIMKRDHATTDPEADQGGQGFKVMQERADQQEAIDWVEREDNASVATIVFDVAHELALEYRPDELAEWGELEI